MSLTTFTAEEQDALDRKWLLPRLLCLPAAIVGIGSLRRGWPTDDWAVVLLFTALTAYALFCWTSCFHECAHQTLTARSWMGVWLGRLLGTVMLTPYTVYRETHIRHHAYLNKPTDWELWPYADPGCSLGFRRVFVWLDLLFGVLTSPYIYGRIYFHHASPLRSPAVRRTVMLEYLAILLFWGSICGTVAWFDHWWPFTRAWIIPWWLAGVFQSGRKLTEHLGMASYDPMLGTRTVVGQGWMTRFLTYINFDIFIHGPHHRHPRMAHNELRAKMSQYLTQNADIRYPVYQNYWRATWAMLPNLLANPGCGINAGAAVPHAVKVAEVGDFVADVAAEVLAPEDRGLSGVRKTSRGPAAA